MGGLSTNQILRPGAQSKSTFLTASDKPVAAAKSVDALVKAPAKGATPKSAETQAENTLQSASKQRGGGYENYTLSMALTVPDKVIEMRRPVQAACLDPQAPHTLVEIGCANGSTTVAMLEALRDAGFSNLRGHGLDLILKYAKDALKTYAPQYEQHPFVNFHWCGAAEKWPRPEGEVWDLFMMSSVVHEIFSYTEPKDSYGAVATFFDKLFDEMPVGGIGFIRDFVAPTHGHAEVVAYHKNDDVKTIECKGEDKFKDNGQKLTFPYLMKRFKQSGGNSTRNDFYCKEINPAEFSKDLPVKPGWTAYKTNQKSLYRFAYGKDFNDQFTVEMNENYAFATEDRYRTMLETAGFDVYYTERNPGAWIKEHRLDNKLEVYTRKGNQGWKRNEGLPFDYQIVIGFVKRIEPAKKIRTWPKNANDVVTTPKFVVPSKDPACPNCEPMVAKGMPGAFLPITLAPAA